ncbi:3-dehydroquinate dehydratase, partial [Stenotrophomonas sp.]
MSIFIIRGPEAAGALIRTAMPLPAPVLKSLVHRAIDAGTSVAIRACGSEQELLDALRVADHSRGEVTLLDPGACANSLRLQRLLPYLHNAYVEVHDDGAVAEPCLP